MAITEEQLLRIVNLMSEELKEYMYESQREIIEEVQYFKEEATNFTKELQLNIDKQYVKLQHIQDDVNLIASTQNSNTIISRLDLLVFKCLMSDILQGQARDRARIEELAVSLENLLTKQNSISSKK